jgi:lipid-A-disaccharide synthase
VTYVGNPLCDELPLELTRAEARRKLGLAADDRVLLIMPGSRKSELKRQLKLVLEASLQIAQRPSLNSLKVLLPLPETADLEAVRAEVQEWRRRRGDAVPEIRISQGDSSIAMVAADVGMIKSGTSTLEAGLLGCGHVLFYKANWLSEFIYFKFIRYGGPVGLVNLVWGKGPETERPFLVTELLGKALTVGSLVRETAKLLEDPQPRETMRAGLAHLREKMLGDLKGQSPSQRAAQTILDELGRA